MDLPPLQLFWTALHFAWPLAFLALLLPFLAALLLRRVRLVSVASDAIYLPFAEALPVTDRPRARNGRLLDYRRVYAASMATFLLLVLAAARPQWIDAGGRKPASGRDVLLVLDVSASMATRDLASGGQSSSRLDVARQLGQAFLERRPGDRAGLVVFASRPYLFVPLTYDLTAVGRALDSAAVGLAGKETALGDAVAQAVRVLTMGRKGGDSADGEPAGREPAGAVAIVISDGANTSGRLSIQQASWLAARQGVRVHTLAIGADVRSDALRSLATQTGGVAARATEASGVASFFAKVDEIEPMLRVSSGAVAEPIELYAAPLALAIGLLLFGEIRAGVASGVLRRRFRDEGPK